MIALPKFKPKDMLNLGFDLPSDILVIPEFLEMLKVKTKLSEKQ